MTVTFVYFPSSERTGIISYTSRVIERTTKKMPNNNNVILTTIKVDVIVSKFQFFTD